MGDVFAIVSKAVFEKEANVDLGDVWPVERYKGAAKVFENTLSGGGRIFMVTVRPPDEQLWLLAVLESPKFDKKAQAWVAAPNTVAATDISSLRKSIKFESGKGMSQDKGALGMSLQTPRALGPGDADQILALTGGGAGKGKSTGAKAPAKASAKEDGKKSTRSRDRIAALLSAIRDEPDDAVNRHVLADAYDAAGDADRANFIRSQVARAELPRWDARAVGMELDERGFLQAHRDEWIGELPAFKGMTYGAFERGLVNWVVFDDAALIGKHLAAAMEAAPISGVMMRWPRRGSRPKLGAVPGLRSLVVSGTLLDNADITWLAKSPLLSTLQELTLENCRLDDDQFAILMDSPHLTRLRRLRLTLHQLGNASIDKLVETSLPQLVELALPAETMDRLGSGGRDGEGINAEGVVQLCNWDQMARVERLDLTGIQMGDTGLAAILTSANTKRLTTLKLRSVSDYDFENDERPDVLQAFEHAKGDRSFEELHIGENEFTPKAGKALKASPVLDKLRILNIDFHNAWGSDPLPKLLDEAKWLDEVHVLSMTDSNLPVVKKLLGRAPKSLHTLKLASAFPRSNLEGLVAAIAAESPQKALQSLDLLGCELDDSALKKLGTLKKQLPALVELRLGVNNLHGYGDDENPFGDDAAEELLASPLGKQLRSITFGIEKLDRLPPPARISLDNEDDDDDDDDDYDDE